MQISKMIVEILITLRQCLFLKFWTFPAMSRTNCVEKCCTIFLILIAYYGTSRVVPDFGVKLSEMI